MKEKEHECYGIRVGAKSYILWCDNWRETTTTPIYPFTKEQAMDIIKNKLPQQFVYISYLINKNTGDTFRCNMLNKSKKTQLHSGITAKVKINN